MNFALTFPGQGSQSIGMLSELSAQHNLVSETFNQASEVLGYDLWTLVESGPEERLNQTERTQPAMLAADIAVLRVLRSLCDKSPSVVAGHSLGEYAALVSAGALEFETAISLVAERGRQMQAAVAQGHGAIAAILGLDDEVIVELCTAVAEDEIVSAVNFNAPGQVAVAGHTSAVDRLIDAAKVAGAKRAIKLALSVPVHCALMEPAARAFASTLENANIEPPTIPVVHNYDVSGHSTAREIRTALIAQISGPVRWTDTIRAFVEDGVTTVFEIGPGRVLSGLCKRIDRNLNAMPVYDPTSLAKAIDVLQGTS